MAHELRDETLRVSKEHEDELLRSLTRQQSFEVTHVDVVVISSCEQTAADARVHRREAPQETENRCIRIPSFGQGCRVMSIVEMGQTGADHPGGDQDPPDNRRKSARTVRRKARERERTAMGLTKTAVSGPRGALDASITSARLHQTC